MYSMTYVTRLCEDGLCLSLRRSLGSPAIKRWPYWMHGLDVCSKCLAMSLWRSGRPGILRTWTLAIVQVSLALHS